MTDKNNCQPAPNYKALSALLGMDAQSSQGNSGLCWLLEEDSLGQLSPPATHPHLHELASAHIPTCHDLPLVL